MTPEEAEEFRMLLYQAWHDAIADLVSQVPGARHIMTPTAAITYTKSNPSS